MKKKSCELATEVEATVFFLTDVLVPVPNRTYMCARTPVAKITFTTSRPPKAAPRGKTPPNCFALPLCRYSQPKGKIPPVIAHQNTLPISMCTMSRDVAGRLAEADKYLALPRELYSTTPDHSLLSLILCVCGNKLSCSRSVYPRAHSGFRAVFVDHPIHRIDVIQSHFIDC